ncbi:MAG: 3-deoxy-7-phosphoheptulonate synthase, partial [Candidatus Omnitrophica bacterium]|nr:3-deoxy-7-phosphoheptulonate synthase [Candidatus Omnitrophota bacterium]
MSFEYIQKIPSAAEILAEMPADEPVRAAKKRRDEMIRAAFESRSEKFILIIGPCSADNEAAVFDYVTRLKDLQGRVAEKLILIPRIYTNKPRTTGVGYKGIAHQPDPGELPNIAEGIRAMRRMHLKIVRETGFTVADEMLYPGNYPYLEDLLSYVAIGARSVENQQHRLTVSGLDIPAGMKNPTSGDFGVMLNSVQAAQAAHVFIYKGWEVKTNGNPLAHCILRGAVDQHGNAIPNYHFEDLKRLLEMYAKRSLVHPALVVDTNHANSDKRAAEQPRIAMEVINSLRMSAEIKALVKGFMIESYIEEGAQAPT